VSKRQRIARRWRTDGGGIFSARPIPLLIPGRAPRSTMPNRAASDRHRGDGRAGLWGSSRWQRSSTPSRARSVDDPDGKIPEALRDGMASRKNSPTDGAHRAVHRYAPQPNRERDRTPSMPKRARPGRPLRVPCRQGCGLHAAVHDEVSGLSRRSRKRAAQGDRVARKISGSALLRLMLAEKVRGDDTLRRLYGPKRGRDCRTVCVDRRVDRLLARAKSAAEGLS